MYGVLCMEINELKKEIDNLRKKRGTINKISLNNKPISEKTKILEGRLEKANKS
jgi:hypothetical protein